ncbi:zinc finger, CCHC-type containing protein [Tanacetum coccineum]
MGGSYYPIPCSILSTGKDSKTSQQYPDVPTTSWRFFYSGKHGTRFKDFTPKIPHHGIDVWLQSNFLRACSFHLKCGIGTVPRRFPEKPDGDFSGMLSKKTRSTLPIKRNYNDTTRYYISSTRVGKKKAYNVLPGGPIYDAILKKKITKKEDIGGNFKIPCSIGGLKHVNALVDQGSDVNVMPYSTYMKLTDEKPAETDIRLSLASHSYIYPLGIAEDVLVEVVDHVYLADFVIMDIKENEKRPFILRMPFLMTAKDSIKFDTVIITLRLYLMEEACEVLREVPLDDFLEDDSSWVFRMYGWHLDDLHSDLGLIGEERNKIASQHQDS